MKNILILAAHPDDEVLGAGGTIQKFREKGYEITTCRVSDGSSEQYKNNPEKWKKKDGEHKQALDLLGVKELIKLDFPDMRLDSVPHVELNKKLSEIVEKIQPEIIFTHAADDINLDHQEIYKSTLIISRPLNKFVKYVYSYEVLSSSEWEYSKPFIPNTYMNIDKYLNKKQQALKMMETEKCEYPHPRSVKGIEVLARYRGLQVGCEFAEAFKLIKHYE